MLKVEAVIPEGIKDLESYRKWVHSPSFPDVGHFAYLAGKVWMDLSMEQVYTHARLKTQICIVLGGLVESKQLGQFFTDGVMVSNPQCQLSNEPDGLFVSYDSLSQDRVHRLPGSEEGVTELVGSPDMVLEVVSRSSVAKDTVDLVDLYYRAGIPEYWLVDARGDGLRFDILRLGPQEYESSPPDTDGWISSTVFGRSFRLIRDTDPAGDPRFTLEVK